MSPLRLRLLFLGAMSCWQVEYAHAFLTPSSSTRHLPSHGVNEIISTKSLLVRAAAETGGWVGGKNAAPAIMYEVDDTPILDPVPDGYKRLFLVRHGEVINPVSCGGEFLFLTFPHKYYQYEIDIIDYYKHSEINNQ
mmetsp:Transcript_18943/g.41259  ORF Transcript_18943/g.41259 Transcript_18943/m.41259 type:complete len:137 (+) Transcript_18943:94-504(+)